jgi:hypothetical protein
MKKRAGSASLSSAERERREFLKKFGRFAAVTPPLITAVLSAPALADDWQSGGHHQCQHHCCWDGDGNCNGQGGNGQGGNGQGGNGHGGDGWGN